MKKLLLTFILMSICASAKADTITDRMIASLEKQGFTVITVSRTWLGRMWLLAKNADSRREVVFDPQTGEILRDYSTGLATVSAETDHSSSDDLPSVTSITVGDWGDIFNFGPAETVTNTTDPFLAPANQPDLLPLIGDSVGAED